MCCGGFVGAWPGLYLFPEPRRPTAGIEISRVAEETQLLRAHDEVVRLYVQEVEGGPRLSEAEQVELLKRAADGDQEATLRLLEAYLQHVVPIAKDYADRGVALLDLIQEGNVGLISALDKLNEIPLEMTFADFATVNIRQSIEERLACGGRQVFPAVQLPLPEYVRLHERWVAS